MKRKILMFFFTVLLLYITVALYLYVPGPSLFYWVAESSNYVSSYGFIANSFIDFLRYIWGGGIFIVLIMCWYLLYLMFWSISVRSEIDRVIGLGAAAIIYSCLSSYYQTDIIATDVAGGVFGLTITHTLCKYVDSFIVVAGLYVLLICSVFIITQPLLIVFTHRFHQIIRRREKIDIQWIRHVPGYSFFKEIGNVYAEAIVKIAVYLKSLFRTSLVPARKEWDKELKTFLHGLQNNTLEAETPVRTMYQEGLQESLVCYKSSKQEDVSLYGSIPQQPKTCSLYILPKIPLLKKTVIRDKTHEEYVERRTKLLEEKLACFGISGTLTAVRPGPVVTVFEFKPSIDTKLSKIISLEDDLSLALSATSVRIIAPIPGTDVVGFEVANMHRTPVESSTILHSSSYKDFKGKLPLVLGENTIGDPIIVDLATMPHLLMAGSTGSGKSVALNTMLISLLCKKTPEDMRLILIDPKRLEFAAYADIAHLLFPIVVDPRKALLVLRWAAKVMEERYEEMAALGARNITDYNQIVDQSSDGKKLPHIVVIIDELADLLLTAGRDVETVIIRIAQMARAAGIHMIVATQRPSVDVITGLVKVNFPSRISFRVTSRGDSRTILDNCGAERLLGKGDMLFLDAGSAYMNRVHGSYISDEEIKAIVSHIKMQQPAQYLDMVQELEMVESSTQLSESDDELYGDIIAFLQEIDEVSISLIQRKFRIGYNRSARLIEKLESQGLIMPPDGSKTRKVIR